MQKDIITQWIMYFIAIISVGGCLRITLELLAANYSESGRSKHISKVKNTFVFVALSITITSIIYILRQYF